MHTTLMIFIKTCYDKTFKNCHLDELLFAEKFLAFKTPLGPRYDDEIPEANRFQLPMLFAYLQSLQVCAREFSCYQQDRYLLCWLGRSGNRVMVEEGGGKGGVRVSGHKELLPPLHFMLYTFTTFCYDYSLLQDTGNWQLLNIYVTAPLSHFMSIWMLLSFPSPIPDPTPIFPTLLSPSPCIPQL